METDTAASNFSVLQVHPKKGLDFQNIQVQFSDLDGYFILYMYVFI